MAIVYKINDGLPPRFLSNPEIIFHLKSFFDTYSDRFIDVPLVCVHLLEKFQSGTERSTPRKFGSFQDRQLNIFITFEESIGNKGKMMTPSPISVFETLRFVMEKEVENYSKNIDTLNRPLITRLKDLGIDIASNKDTVANEIKGSLGLNGYQLDFNKRIAMLSDEDLYQLGAVMIVTDTHSLGKTFSKEEIIFEVNKKLAN